MSSTLKATRKIELKRDNTAAPIITIICKNTSPGALAPGDLVVWDKTTNSTAGVISCTTTTSAANVDVLGMVIAPMAVGASGEVQIWGPTTLLKADGTTAIAVGDMLGTFTVAKVCAKAITGGRFARAMEAYSTAGPGGVIDAFITNLNLAAFSVE